MSRVLIVENNRDTLRIIERCLDGMGYELFPTDEQERMKLELRAHEPALILASSEMFGGSGLDVVSDLYTECPSPVPVIVYSSAHTLSALKDITPPGLNVGAFLGSPLDPGELVQSVMGLTTPPDLVAAKKIVAGLRAEYEEHGLHLEAPTHLLDLSETPFARLLWAVAQNSWTGRLSLQGPPSDAIDWWFVKGQFSHAQTHGDRDLVDTAVAEGRLDPAKLPDVVLNNKEEQLGLLMAYRVIGMHESDALEKRTAERLLMEGLIKREGTIEAFEDESADHKTGALLALPRLVMRLTSEHVDELRTQAIQAHPDSVAVIRLPSSKVIEGWGLETRDDKVIQLIEKARNQEITLEQLVRVAGDGNAEDQSGVRALMALLWAIGFLDFRGKPWDEETSNRIDQLVKDLHRANRGNLFEVLGLDVAASEKEIKTKNRDLARKYHPDTLFEEHPRVQRLAEAMYARVQEAVSTLLDKEKRDALRQELQKRKRGGAGRGSGVSEPQKAQVAIKQGELYLRNKAYEGAAVFFRDATLLDPENPDGFVLLGWAQFLRDPSNTAGATKTVETAIKLSPKHPDAWYYLGRMALLKSDPERARRRFQKTLTFDPNHVGATREIWLMERRDDSESDRRKEPRQQGIRSLFGRRKED